MLGNKGPQRLFISKMEEGTRFVTINNDGEVVTEGIFVSQKRGADGRTRVQYARADGQPVEVFAYELGLVPTHLNVRTYPKDEVPTTND